MTTVLLTSEVLTYHRAPDFILGLYDTCFQKLIAISPAPLRKQNINWNEFLAAQIEAKLLKSLQTYFMQHDITNNFVPNTFE